MSFPLGLSNFRFAKKCARPRMTLRIILEKNSRKKMTGSESIVGHDKIVKQKISNH
jgi:hypothetical protein